MNLLGSNSNNKEKVTEKSGKDKLQTLKFYWKPFILMKINCEPNWMEQKLFELMEAETSYEIVQFQSIGQASRVDHRSPRLNIKVRGVAQIFAKIPQGVNTFWTNVRGVLYFGFCCIFINKFFEKFPGGGVLCPPPHSGIIYTFLCI